MVAISEDIVMQSADLERGSAMAPIVISSVSSAETKTTTPYVFCSPEGIVGAFENPQDYCQGGWHPVHIGDRFDRGRFEIVHKLGSGGFGAVWLAEDLVYQRWVALKIFRASITETDGHRLTASVTNRETSTAYALPWHYFVIEGPNGNHLCLVSDVLGPSLNTTSFYLQSRVRPAFARKVCRKLLHALARLHARDVCHGDLTPNNVLFRLKDFEKYSRQDLHRIFGHPVKFDLKTQGGHRVGPEAPRYIVQHIDFLAANENIISDEVALIDFDLSFKENDPPVFLGTARQFLAPEVAVGKNPSKASDIWALAATFFVIRSGFDLVSGASDLCGASIIEELSNCIGEYPPEWRDILFGDDGEAVSPGCTGWPLGRLVQSRPDHNLPVYIGHIWDAPNHWSAPRIKPRSRVLKPKEIQLLQIWDHQAPYPFAVEQKFYQPAFMNVGGQYVTREMPDNWTEMHAFLPKMPRREAELFYDLLSRMLTWTPEERCSLSDIVDHPWFDYR